MKITLSDSRLLLTKAAHTSPSIRKRKGSFLVEASISLFILVAIAVVLVDASMNILKPRSWTMKQNLVDAYLSQEVADANNLPFDEIVGSAWGAGDLDGADAILTTEEIVELGLMPSFTAGGDGRSYDGVVRRQLTELANDPALPDFTPAAAGGALALSDMGIKSYKLQSHISYVIDGQTYIKSRTVIRSQ